MKIEFHGKEYESDGWQRPIIENLLKKELVNTETERKRLQNLNDTLEYGTRIFEMIDIEKDIKYKLDQMSGIPML